MHSKPTIFKMANLAGRVNILQNLVLVPARDEVNEAVMNIPNKVIPNRCEDPFAVENSEGEEAEEEAEEKEARELFIQNVINDLEEPVHPNPEPIAAVQEENNNVENELIRNDVDMLDVIQQPNFEQEVLLTMERDLLLYELQNTRTEVQERLQHLLSMIQHCNELLEVLNKREGVIKEQYTTLRDQQRLLRIIKQ